MSAAEFYRKFALDLRAKALKAPSDTAAAGLHSLAQCYLALAILADHDSPLAVSIRSDVSLREDREGA